MSTIAEKTRITPQDLLDMPDSKDFELVGGELVERNMGWKASWVGGRLHRWLGNYTEERGIGRVAPADASYQCFPNAPGKVRKPDASFITFERLPPEREPEGHCTVAPDLAAEVVSPNDLYYEVEEKVAEYLEAGVRLVWVVNPATRSVRVHRRDGTITDLEENDELTGEDVIPGFRCRVGDLFAVPTAAAIAPPSS
ncbi:MAG: Uma2 family endonuclease [Planctomycetes bacterium]|nr:Uma2 family endonuclease [Planctomycetota bacterium]